MEASLKVELGHPAQKIAEFAEERVGADLVVIASMAAPPCSECCSAAWQRA